MLLYNGKRVTRINDFSRLFYVIVFVTWQENNSLDIFAVCNVFVDDGAQIAGAQTLPDLKIPGTCCPENHRFGTLSGAKEPPKRVPKLLVLFVLRVPRTCDLKMFVLVPLCVLLI